MNSTELDTVLQKQAEAYERWECYKEVGDIALAKDEWKQIIYYQKRIEQLTRVENGQENLQ